MRLQINSVGMVRGGGATHRNAFVDALIRVRPDWDLLLYESRSSPKFSSTGIRTESVNRSSWRRIGWDSFTVGRRAGATGADVLLNMANYGPVCPHPFGPLSSKLDILRSGMGATDEPYATSGGLVAARVCIHADATLCGGGGSK